MLDQAIVKNVSYNLKNVSLNQENNLYSIQ